MAALVALLLLLLLAVLPPSPALAPLIHTGKSLFYSLLTPISISRLYGNVSLLAMQIYSIFTSMQILLPTSTFLLTDDQLNFYFAVLSQQCIPIHSFNFIYKSFFSSTKFSVYLSFIEILSGELQLWDRYITRGESVMLPEVPFDWFRVGSQFFMLTQKHMIRDRKLWRKFKLPCLNKDSCYPEEHYFPTLLSMKDPDGCTRYTLTRVNWTGSTDGHSYTYYPSKISPELIHELRESNNTYSHMFARKFSPDCLKPLMDIADKVIFRD